MKTRNSGINNFRATSELHSYNKSLEEVTPGNPVILTKNDYGKYANFDISEYKKIERGQVASELVQIIDHTRAGALHSLEDVKWEIMNRQWFA